MAVHEALIWGACAIVVAVVVIALARLTAPHWPLAVTALTFSVLLFVGEIVDNLPSCSRGTSSRQRCSCTRRSSPCCVRAA